MGVKHSVDKSLSCRPQRRDCRSYGMASSVRREALALNLRELKKAERECTAAREAVCKNPEDEKALDTFLSAVQHVSALKKERAKLWR